LQTEQVFECCDTSRNRVFCKANGHQC